MAELGSAGLSSYCASKSAITSTVKALALELASKKVRINSVEPGYVMTDLLKKTFSKMSSEEIEVIKKQHPLGLGTPNQVANVVCFLLSDLSSWITGTNIVVDGGYSAH
jgi:NAD(P)-dependent dehydrogenase (short-subunit alcohol dehydrogenase family)